MVGREDRDGDVDIAPAVEKPAVVELVVMIEGVAKDVDVEEKPRGEVPKKEDDHYIKY